MLQAAITRTVGVCTRHPWPIVLISLLLTAGCGFYAATHWRIDTDTLRIMPDTLPWRRAQLNYQKTFPQRPMLAVVRAPTPETTELAAEALAAALVQRTDRFHVVRQPQGGSFLRRAALLFLATDQVARATKRLEEARPLLGELAADPSLRGAAGALIFGAQAIEAHHGTPQDMAKPMDQLADTLQDVLAGRFATFSWRELLGGPAQPDARRRFILLDPALDYTSLQPGAAATRAIEQAAASVGMDQRYGATLQLTGSVPINDQQFSTLRKDSGWNTLGTAAAVLVILWLALRSPRIITAVALSLVAGFTVTAALGLLMIGSFNLISVAFAVLFIGLGADFGIQYAVRYRAERHRTDHQPVDAAAPALRAAAGRAGVPLALATASTAAGFFSFLPTQYRGMAELGQIAGVGMLVALVATLTLLPALLAILRPPGEPHRMGFRAFAPADRFLQRHRIAVVGGTIGVVLLVSPLLLHVRFDFDPTHLQPPNAPAVRAYHQLAGDPQAGLQAINVAAPSLDAARRLAEQLRSVPEVGTVRTVDALIPAEQAAKLGLIEPAARALEPALNPRATKPEPTDAEDVAALRRAAEGLVPLARGGSAAAQRLHPLLLRLAEADATTRRHARDALIPPLRDDLTLVRDMLRPERVTLDDIPRDLAADWLAPDERARVEVLPRGNANDDATQRRFADAVLAVAPDAAGEPVDLVGSERTVTRAFIKAGICAVVAITVILWVTLRRFADVLMTLIPLLVAGLVTLEVIAAIGEPLNFANIIALPLLLGVGVAFKIYYITAWRAGATDLLETALTRAILFSAMTTATAFGSLWLSSQPGLSSMGKLMALALLCTLAAAVLFQPALMGPPRQRDGQAAASPELEAVADSDG